LKIPKRSEVVNRRTDNTKKYLQTTTETFKDLVTNETRRRVIVERYGHHLIWKSCCRPIYRNKYIYHK